MRFYGGNAEYCDKLFERVQEKQKRILIKASFNNFLSKDFVKERFVDFKSVDSFLFDQISQGRCFFGRVGRTESVAMGGVMNGKLTEDIMEFAQLHAGVTPKRLDVFAEFTELTMKAVQELTLQGLVSCEYQDRNRS